MLIYSGAFVTAAQDYPLVASINGNVVSVYETPSTQSQSTRYARAVHQFSLPAGVAAQVKNIVFSPKSSFSSPRILLALTNTIHVYSALRETPSFHATIINAASPSSALQSASFLTVDDVLLVPELAPRVTIRSIVTGLGVELRDVKSVISTTAFQEKTSKEHLAYSIREKSGHVAFLTRPAVGKDVVTVLNSPKAVDGSKDAGTRTIEVEFPIATSDARGLQFSPDGAWLAVWDSMAGHDAAAGTTSTVCIYTPNGRLFKRWKGSDESGDKDLDLGVETINWISDGRLAIALVDGRVVILTARTFDEQATISHPAVFDRIANGASIHVESIDPNTGARTYASATLPAAAPTRTTNNTANTAPCPRGVTHLEISADGKLLASVLAHTPTTVHITSLTGPRLATRAILIHHAAVKSLEWHPRNPAWLLIRTVQQRSDSTDTVYTWCDNLPEPMVIKASIPQAVLKVLNSTASTSPATGAGSGVSTSWLIAPKDSHPDAIQEILFSFPIGGICMPALSSDESEWEDLGNELEWEGLNPTQIMDNDVTPRQPALSPERLTQKTPIRGHGVEDAFDQSFEQLRAESLAQSVSESVTDGGFSPVKFDATDWTRRQVLGEPGDDQDDTFVGKGRR